MTGMDTKSRRFLHEHDWVQTSQKTQANGRETTEERTMERIQRFVLVLVTAATALSLVSCGGGNPNNSLVTLDIKNLPPISNPSFVYTAWVRQSGKVSKLDSFNTQSDGSLRLSRFSLLKTLGTGDDVFITIEPNPSPDTTIPSHTVALTGTIAGNTAVLLFPAIQSLANTTGFATVSGAGNRQLFTEFLQLPDLEAADFIYQGWVQVGPAPPVPLQKFDFSQIPVSDTVVFDLTNARYFLTAEPVPDPDPNVPFSVEPLFTNGLLQALIRQPLTRSSLVPDTPDFNFPSAAATVQ